MKIKGVDFRAQLRKIGGGWVRELWKGLSFEAMVRTPLLMDRVWDLKSDKEQVLYPGFIIYFVTLDKLLKMSEPQIPCL